jgi:biotin carboxyl carrier protein
MKFTAVVQGEQVELELKKVGRHTIEVEVGVGGRKYTAEAKAVEPGVFWLNWNNQSLEIAVTQDTDSYMVSWGDRHIAVEIVDARAALRKAAQHGQAGVVELRAPMPGKIVKVLAGEGAEVRPNQGILVMEAMKMQNEIKSPKQGVVKKLEVSEGAAVNSGDLLAIVE